MWRDEGTVLAVFNVAALRERCRIDLGRSTEEAVRLQYFTTMDSASARVSIAPRSVAEWVSEWKDRSRKAGPYAECWKIGTVIAFRAKVGRRTWDEQDISALTAVPSKIVLLQLAAPMIDTPRYFAVIHVEVTTSLTEEIGVALTDEIATHLPGASLTVFARRDRWFAATPLFPTSFAFFGAGFPPALDSVSRVPTWRCTKGAGRSTRCEQLDGTKSVR